MNGASLLSVRRCGRALRKDGGQRPARGGCEAPAHGAGRALPGPGPDTKNDGEKKIDQSFFIPQLGPKVFYWNGASSESKKPEQISCA